MSQSNHPNVDIGCPTCNSVVSTTVPTGPGIRPDEAVRETEWEAENRLYGIETTCRNCGHEVELYYY